MEIRANAKPRRADSLSRGSLACKCQAADAVAAYAIIIPKGLRASAPEITGATD